MPAYRSADEAEIRDEVVKHLRELIPGCRIIHEVNASSFGNRIDVLAVGRVDMAAVEIKSKKDKLDRLPDQIKAMRRVSNRVYAALHEKFLTELRGEFYPPTEADGATVWVYPKAERKGHVDCRAQWRPWYCWGHKRACLPHYALGMLWRDELQAICAGLGMTGTKRMNMDEAADHIQWRMTGEQITRAICDTLRARKCVEADPEI